MENQKMENESSSEEEVEMITEGAANIKIAYPNMPELGDIEPTPSQAAQSQSAGAAHSQPGAVAQPAHSKKRDSYSEHLERESLLAHCRAVLYAVERGMHKTSQPAAPELRPTSSRRYSSHIHPHNPLPISREDYEFLLDDSYSQPRAYEGSHLNFSDVYLSGLPIWVNNTPVQGFPPPSLQDVMNLPAAHMPRSRRVIQEVMSNENISEATRATICQIIQQHMSSEPDFDPEQFKSIIDLLLNMSM